MTRKEKVVRILASSMLSAALLASPVVAENPEIRMGSYKGTALEAGERSCLIIGPVGAEYEASSSDQEVVVIERVLTYWVAVAKTKGTAEITVTGKSGTTGSLILTVSPVEDSAGIDLSENMEIRLEMVRLINQVRRENGLAELPTNEALMNAAQDVSSQCVMEHRPYDHKALARYGWPYGALYNLTVFTAYGCPDIAKQAVTYWIESPGHYETMLSKGSHIGTGVTFKNGRAYCYMVVGDPDSCNPYT